MVFCENDFQSCQCLQLFIKICIRYLDAIKWSFKLNPFMQDKDLFLNANRMYVHVTKT